MHWSSVEAGKRCNCAIDVLKQDFPGLSVTEPCPVCTRVGSPDVLIGTHPSTSSGVPAASASEGSFWTGAFR